MAGTKQNQSIQRAVELLQLLAQGVNRLEDIHPRTDLARSTVHRFLKSLAASGLAVQDPRTRHYHLGPVLLALAANPRCAHHLLTLSAEGELQRLREVSGETALLLIPAGLQRMVVAAAPSTRRLRLTLEVGYTSPIYDGSAGLVLLSQYAEPDLAAVLGAVELRPIDFSTITDPRVLRLELEKIRRQGYATFVGMAPDESAAASVPVPGYTCPVALCLFGPKFRFDPLKAVDDLKAAAGRITARLIALGLPPPPAPPAPLRRAVE